MAHDARERGSVSLCAVGWIGHAAARCGIELSAVPGLWIDGYRRYRCGNGGKQFNERSVGVLNRARHPSGLIALVVLWRLHHKLRLRDQAEMFLTRGFIFSYEAERDWQVKLKPALAKTLRRRRKGKVGPAGTLMRLIFGCGADGGICVGRSIVTAL
jgi:hypothetical protein